MYFEKWNFLVLILIFLYIFSYFDKRQPRKKIIVFQETETLKGLLIFQGIELFSPSSTKFPILLETEAPKKSLIISQKKTVLIFQEKKPLKVMENVD